MTTITIKTAKLLGAALDWAVAKCENVDINRDENGFVFDHYYPSSDWTLGGPIIERESLWVREHASMSPAIAHIIKPHEKWLAYATRRYDGGDYACYVGETYLAAAMRCYVASKLGDTVDIPQELT